TAAFASAERPWTDVLQAHVNVVLKCLVARRRGVPDAVHRSFARASGLTLFPWFEAWLLDGSRDGAALGDRIAALPEALAADRAGWAHLADGVGAMPPTMNLALISPSSRRACVVVPDAWSEQTIARALAGWRLLTLPVLPYSEGGRRPRAERRPVIA